MSNLYQRRCQIDTQEKCQIYTREVVHTDVEARIRGVIGLLIGRGPEIDQPFREEKISLKIQIMTVNRTIKFENAICRMNYNHCENE